MYSDKIIWYFSLFMYSIGWLQWQIIGLCYTQATICISQLGCIWLCGGMAVNFCTFHWNFMVLFTFNFVTFDNILVY